MKRDTDYLFAINKIKVLENRMLNKSILNRMIDAADAFDAYKMLQETPYGEFLNEHDSPYDFENVIGKHIEDVYRTVDEATGSTSFTRFFRVREDYLNCKVLLKVKNFNGENYHLSSMGTISPEILNNCFKNEDFSELPEYLRIAIEKSKELFIQTEIPGYIDFAMDRFMYEHLYEMAREDSFLRGYIEREIDLINIRSFIRIKLMDESIDFLKAVLLDHGRLDKDFFYNIFNEQLAGLADRFKFTDYASVAEQGIKSWLESGSSMEMERLCDNYLLEYARQGKFSAFGTKPIWGFILGKLNEARLLRIVMVGKLNDIAKDLISERLRDAYV
ncbi:V-type ATP synthase subunit C [Calorimonas adulescens]|jgi:ATP synthase (C/AC39) subunit.|uniref:V-type ATP synthase subunit C n=1 Tax=Calorimonas adulescens TaxID=2606906 RepID=A0A5D8QBS8_9THEO|nr:V-type ATP synthase subunit C [Calorimonas adulescens]TZE81246.1 V-type ATP synthase subunit C [Calorimonas adulescens]